MELTRNLRADTVSRMRPTPPWSIESSRPVSEAVQLMRWQKIGCLLVTRAGRLAGIFTERDLLARVLATGLSLETPLSACMTIDPVTITLKDVVRTAIKRMEKGGYRHLPVIDDGNRPVGLLSAHQIVHYLAEHFPGLVYNQPPDPSRFPDEADGA